MPLWSITREEKLELVDTCTRYDVAPLEALQVSVGAGEIPVAPLAGEPRTGGSGTPDALRDERTKVPFGL